MDEWAEALIEALLELPSATVYLLVALLCWAEAAFFLGFITPGELAVAAAGILASQGRVQVAPLAGIVVAATLAGNGTGFLLGRRWGAGVLEWAPLQRILGEPIAMAQAFMRRRGEWAIVLGRVSTPTRIVVPFLAGASGMPYRRFLLFDAPATVIWAGVWIALGFILGESWERIQEVAGTAAILVLILFVLAVVIRWLAARVAANQRRIRAFGLWLLRVTGTRGPALFLAPGFRWLGRRLNPRLAQGLGLTIGFVALLGAVGGVGLVLSQTQAVRGLALIDFPVLEWMVGVRTQEAVNVARTGLLAFHWPGIFGVAIPLMGFLAWWVGWVAAIRVGLGLVGAAGGAYLLDRMVLEGVVPRAEFPSVPVAVAAGLLVHLTAITARRLGWGPSVACAAVCTFLLCTVALGTVVAGWAAPSGIALGMALGLAWATALELPWTIQGSKPDPTGPRRAPASTTPPSSGTRE